MVGAKSKVVCAICGEKRKKMPVLWVIDDCLSYCNSCWESVRCSTCAHHDPKGQIIRGRWTCRACRHHHKVRGAGDTHESFHLKIIEDENGEALVDIPTSIAPVNGANGGTDVLNAVTTIEDVEEDGENENEDQLAPLQQVPPIATVGCARQGLGHVVLLLDASGSMRIKDVICDEPSDEKSGHALSRVEAVAMRAACFVRAHGRDRPRDVFSLAVFNEKAEIVCQNVDAVDAQKALEGVVLHGANGTSYSTALAVAAKLLALVPGVTNHVLLLSDGRPADPKDAIELFQSRFLQGEHAGTRLHGIGFGALVESFAPLQQLACLSGGAFALANCTVRGLCDAFSSVSSTITSMSGGSSVPPGSSISKHSMRPAHFEPPELGVFGKHGVLSFRATRTIFRYDGASFNEQHWPAADVKRRVLPYMRGGMRLVYAFQDTLAVSEQDGWMVAKNSRFLDEALNTRMVVETHAKSTAVACHFASRFNMQIRSVTASASSTTSDIAGAAVEVPVNTRIFFVPCFVYEVEGHLAIKEQARFFAGERYLPGVFLKYNSNNGYVSEDVMRHHEAVQAFTHFTFVMSGGSLLVADLQGVAREEEALLTDPQVLSLAGDFGPGDLRAPGMRACLAAHRCGSMCRKLGLQPVSRTLLQRLEPARAPGVPGGGCLASKAALRSTSGISSNWEKVSEHSATSAEWDIVLQTEACALSDGVRSSHASTSSWVNLGV